AALCTANTRIAAPGADSQLRRGRAVTSLRPPSRPVATEAFRPTLPTPERHAMSGASQASSRVILAVDDSASMRQMVRYTLEGAGYTVVQAADGVEALDFAKTSGVDLVLTDVNMPRMDGITLVRELRALQSYKFTPMLVLTTESGQETKQ